MRHLSQIDLGQHPHGAVAPVGTLIDTAQVVERMKDRRTIFDVGTLRAFVRDPIAHAARATERSTEEGRGDQTADQGEFGGR